MYEYDTHLPQIDSQYLVKEKMLNVHKDELQDGKNKIMWID